MGLGKTLSAIALISWHLDVLESSGPEISTPRATLIVTPKSSEERPFFLFFSFGLFTYDVTNRYSHNGMEAAIQEVWWPMMSIFFFKKKNQLSDSRDKSHVKPERIRVFSHHGPNRQRLASVWQDFDVVLTNYDTVRSEHSSAGPIFDISWARVILDEGRVSRRCR